MQRLYQWGYMTKFKNKYRIESARRPGWNYAGMGWYFVTICTANREHYFGKIVNGVMQLSLIGKTADAFFRAIPEHTQAGCTVDRHQIMPNHMHGIIVIEHPVETLQCNVSTTTDPHMSAIAPKAGSLSAIVRSYKSAVRYWCRKTIFPNLPGKPDSMTALFATNGS